MTVDELIERMEKAEGPDRCWLWPRKLDHAGRGHIWHEGRLMLAHRAVWTVRIGPIPAGAVLCHHCDNPTCVNPAHLYVGSSKDNARDMIIRGRAGWHRHPEVYAENARRLGKRNTWARGEGNPKAKLSAADAAAIAASQENTKILVARYGVARTTIQRIRSGVQWATIKGGPNA